MRRLAALQFRRERGPDFGVDPATGAADAGREGKGSDGFRAQSTLPGLDLRLLRPSTRMRDRRTPKGRPPEVGEIFVQSDLGRTLTFMADEERKVSRRKGRKAGLKAARDAFYKGDIARDVTRFIEKEGGLMRFEDFAGFKVNFEPTVRTRLSWTPTARTCSSSTRIPRSRRHCCAPCPATCRKAS